MDQSVLVSCAEPTLKLLKVLLTVCGFAANSDWIPLVLPQRARQVNTMPTRDKSTVICGALSAMLLSVASAVGLSAQQVAADSSQLARGFVASFYQWYVPAAGANRAGPAYVVALKEKRAAFSAELYRALKADRDAQARVAGEIVGLDSDPFLNSQDLCDGFEVGGVVRYRDTYRIQVFAVCEGKRADRPSALADVRAAGGHWEFVNFYDADGKNDLLATLKALAAERRKADEGSEAVRAIDQAL